MKRKIIATMETEKFPSFQKKKKKVEILQRAAGET